MREVVTSDTSAQTAYAHVKMGAARAGRGWRTRGTEVLTLRAVKCRKHVGERQIDPVRFVDSYQLRLAAPMRIERSDEIAFSSGLITLRCVQGSTRASLI